MRLAATAAAVGTVLLLTACGGGGTDEATTESPATASAEATTEEATVEATTEDAAAASTAEVDAAITEMVSGMALLATLTGSDAEADVAIAAGAYEYFVTGVGELEKAANVPADVLAPAVETSWAVVDATANFQLSLEALVEGTGDAETASAAMDALIQASDALNLASDSLAQYTSLTESDLAALYEAAS